jgi:hypothetical protein
MGSIKGILARIRIIFLYFSYFFLIVSSALFLEAGIWLLSTPPSASPIPGFGGVAYIVPFGAFILGIIFAILSLILHFVVRKQFPFKNKKYVLVWFALFILSILTFIVPLIIMAQLQSSQLHPPR